MELQSHFLVLLKNFSTKVKKGFPCCNHVHWFQSFKTDLLTIFAYFSPVLSKKPVSGVMADGRVLFAL